MTSIPPAGFGQPPERQPQADEPLAAYVPAPRPVGVRGWNPWLGLAAIAVGIGITVFVGVIAVFGASAFGASVDNPPPGVTIAVTVAQNLALLGAALGLAWITGRPVASDFGLCRPRSLWIAIGLLLAIWIGFYLVAYIWSEALSLKDTQELPDELGADGTLLNQLAVVVLITVVAPLGEELFFRGFFFASLRNWKGPWLAAILTGVVFGAIHAGSSPVGYLVPLAIFGISLCLLYEWTGSLYPCIALHALNNSVALAVTQKWSGAVALAMMVGSVILTLLIAWLAGRVLGDTRPVGRTPLPAPA